MKKDKKFEVVHEESLSFGTSVSVIKDRQTGVLYLFVAGGGGMAGGLSPLLDKDGKPVIAELK